MAITFVGSDVASSGGSNTDTLTCLLPSIQADDVAIIYGRSDETGSVATLAVSGWTLIDNQNPEGGRDRVEYLWWRKLDGSESDPEMTTDVSRNHSMSLHVFRGAAFVHPPIFVFNSGENNTSPTNSAVTTLKWGSAVVLFHGATRNDFSAAGAPSGYTMGESTMYWHSNQFVAYDLNVGDPGTETPGAWTHTASPTTTAEWSVYTLVLRNAAKGTAVVTYGGSVAATGTSGSVGVGTVAYGGSVTATGTSGSVGVGVVAYGGSVTATGTSGADGVVATSYGGAVVATGKRTATGVAVAAYGSAVTATGAVSTSGVASLSYGGAVVVVGTSGADGVSVVSYGGSVSATGTVTAVGVVAAVYANAVEATGTNYLSRLILPTENTLSPLDVPKYHVASRSRNLARFMAPGARQKNVWILTDGTVTSRQPADMTTVSRMIPGGHVPPDDLSSEERTLLTDAGYSFERVLYAEV